MFPTLGAVEIARLRRFGPARRWCAPASAGQAAVFLATQARRVTLLVRKPLAATMSRYLIDRIDSLANVEVIEDVEVPGLEGEDGRLGATAPPAWKLDGR